MLAIVIPYYKITFFDSTLQSLASQTDKRFKVYIGDDTSSENPLALLEKYNGQFEYTYHRFENNLGGNSLVKQWERCIDLSGDEEWIMILGDDDVLGENVVDEFYNNYSLFNSFSNVIRYATKIKFERTQSESDVYFHPQFEHISNFLDRKNSRKSRSSLSEYIFSRKIYLKYGFADYPLAYHSDDRAWIEFSENNPIFSINKAIIIFRLSEKNISGNWNEEFVDLKHKASIAYFYDVLNTLCENLSKKTILYFLLAYEKYIKKKRKLSWGEWMFLIKKYYALGIFIPFLKVLRRMFISYFKI